MNIAVLIKSCQKFAGRRDACRQTWIPGLHEHGIPYFFLVGGEPDANTSARAELDTITAIGYSDNYRAIAPKLARGLQFMLSQPVQRIFVCDDDTYVCVDRLLDVLVQKENELADYEGWFRPASEFNEGYAYMQGSAVWYSRRAAELVANSPLMVEGVMDDVRHGQVFNGMPITFDNDERYWPGPVAYPIQKCNNIITTHKCDPAEMKRIHQIWENSCL